MFKKLSYRAVAVTTGVLVITAGPAAISGLSAADAAGTSTATYSAAQVVSAIPKEKPHWVFTGLTFSLTSTGYKNCAANGENIGLQFQCIPNDPIQKRLCLWVFLI